MKGKKKPTAAELEARISAVEQELYALKAAYFNVALDDIKRPSGPFAILTFAAAGDIFAVPLWGVAGVSWAVAPAEAEGLVLPFLGVVNYRGDAVPLLDAAVAVGGERQGITSHHQIIYISAGGRKIGLLVEQALDVESIEGGRVTMAGEGGLSRRLYFGAYDRLGEFVRILDPAALTVRPSDVPGGPVDDIVPGRPTLNT